LQWRVACAIVKVMPVSIQFLRGILAVLSMFFAWQAGRMLVAFRRGEARQSRVVAWVVRTAVCALAMLFPMRAVDMVALVVWALDFLSFAVAVRAASRPKPEEDLTHTIFPDES
jgi:hypothetical protein